uniref:Uncharacterized protein n=1 Tax=Prymnesium polylepis TaxID=72548 RepID=A0A7S4HY23_9EUKA
MEGASCMQRPTEPAAAMGMAFIASHLRELMRCFLAWIRAVAGRTAATPALPWGTALWRRAQRGVQSRSRLYFVSVRCPAVHDVGERSAESGLAAGSAKHAGHDHGAMERCCRWCAMLNDVRRRI